MVLEGRNLSGLEVKLDLPERLWAFIHEKYGDCRELVTFEDALEFSYQSIFIVCDLIREGAFVKTVYRNQSSPVDGEGIQLS